MYAWAGIMYYVPLKYKFCHGLPDILVPDKRRRIYQSFGIISTFTVGSFILYRYNEAFFRQTTWVEKMFLIGFHLHHNARQSVAASLVT